MGLYYKLLGLTAVISQRMSRTRVNFMPLNLGCGAAISVVVVVCFGMVAEALGNNEKPVTATIGDVIAGKNKQDYVTIKGDIIPKARLREVEERDGKETSTTAVFTLLVDKATQQAIFVQTKPEESVGEEPHAYTAQGMVRSPESDLVKEIDKVSAEAGIKIDNAHLLKLGESPASLAPALFFFVLTALGALLFWVSYAKLYIIFKKDSSVAPISSGYAGKPADMAVAGTGEFTLDTGDRQRFLAMPCATVELETGDVGFICNVNASNTFFGVTTKKREGLWIMAVRRDGSVRFTRGTQFLGFGGSPAVKLEFNDALSGRRQSGYLMFDSDSDRDAMLSYLSAHGTPHAVVPDYPPPAVAAGAPAVPAGATADFDV